MEEVLLNELTIDKWRGGDVEAHTRRWNLKIARVYKESIETGDGIGALHKLKVGSIVQYQGHLQRTRMLFFDSDG